VDATVAIETDSLRKTYRTTLGRGRLEALRDVTFQVERAQIFGLVGPNGAGKTTLLKVLLGIVRPSGGSARLLGEEAGSLKARLRVGYLPENLRIPGHHTADSALSFYGRLSGLSAREGRDRREDLLARVGLAAWSRVKVGKFSQGMLQRLGLAGALLHDPDLLILDEPTKGLDPGGRKLVRDIFLEAKQQGKTVFVNSHMLQELELVCDQVAILNQGQLRAVGAVNEIRQRCKSSRVILELEGSETEARAALDMFGDVVWQTTGGSRYRVELSLADQAAIDQCIDGLRAGGISILGLERGKATLEEAFLKIVAAELVDPAGESEQP
jgi:ABC-2 type transport system ATP-binding protein